MPRIKIALALLTLSTTLAIGSSAQAATWTPLASGTTETITALDYRGAGQVWYATSTGKIFKNGAQVGTAGVPINDLAMSPDGSTGLAVGVGGKVMRSTDGGGTWSPVVLGAISYPNTTCGGPGTAGAAGAVTESLTGVAWSTNSVAYVVGPATGNRDPLLKSVNGGATFTDINRVSTGACLVSSEHGLTDVTPVPGTSTVYFISRYFGRIYVSYDDLASLTMKVDSVNHSTGQPRVAVSAEHPDWIYSAEREQDGLSLNFEASTDSAGTFKHLVHANDNSNVPALYGIGSSGATTLAAGDGGAIYLSVDGVNTYRVEAGQTTSWRALSMASATSAAVAGIGGVIATTDNANVIPDTTAPSGAINDPGTVKALTPKAFTAVLTDNAGGGGIDPASITWSATASGASPVTGTGNPVNLTFPIAGFWTVTVTFKDLAGNSASATRSFTVGAPAPTPAPATRTTTATVPGAKVTFGTPKQCVNAGKSFKVTLSWKKLKKKGNGFIKITRVDFYIAGKVVKKDTKAPFAQRLTVKAGTVSGSTVKLRARAFMKVRSGKRPTKSLNTTVKTC